MRIKSTVIAIFFAVLPILFFNETSFTLHAGGIQTQKTFPDIKHRCPKNKIWNEKNIAKWLNVPVSRIKVLKAARSFDNTALCTLPSEKLIHAFSLLNNPPRPYKHDQAMIFRAKQQSVNGVVKPDGLIIANKERQQIVAESLKAIAADRSGKTIIKGAAGIINNQWATLGPENIGGRIRSVFIHPKDPKLIFVGSVSGGIWKSIDGGNSWSAINDFMANLAITCIVADPRTTDNIKTTVLYAATGEGFYNIDSIRGYGVFKSTDGGETWHHMVSTDPKNEDSDWYAVNRIAVNNNGIIIAVSRSNAVFVSSDDGKSWKKSTPGPKDDSMMDDVKFDPNDPVKAIVGSTHGNCYYTTDSGKTWNQSTIVDISGDKFTGRVEIAYAHSSANTVFASVDHNNGEIYRSNDGGVTWAFVSKPEHLWNEGWYANTIWVDPVNTDHLVIGGLDLYQSTDGGKNWIKISTWQLDPQSPHADQHMIINDPDYDGSTNKKVYFSNDGGLYKAEDIENVNDTDTNNGWTSLNHGLAITQFYGAAALSDSNITGGTQDNGTLLQTKDSASSWCSIFGGDGGFSAVSHQSLDRNKFYYFGEYVHLQIHRSDNGMPGEYIFNGIGDAGNKANFIAPFVLDPNNENIMLGGGESLWKCSNIRAENKNDIEWTSIKAPLSDNSKISQIAVAKGNSDLILVGYNNGEIYKTENGTSVSPNWTIIHQANYKFVLSLLIDKDNHNIFYAGWGGFACGNLKKTSTRGATWKNIGNNLPKVPVRSITRHPKNANYLYIGTEVGVFTSEDQGLNWFSTNDGPANVSVDQLFWKDDSSLVAVTHGRGLFKVKIPLENSKNFYPAIVSYLLN